MLLGQSVHMLDEKNRFILPARFNGDTNKSAFMVLTAGTEQCLFLFNEFAWNNITERLQNMSQIGEAEHRAFKRVFFSMAMEIKLDTQRRVLIPNMLLKFAGIKKNIMIIGVGDRIEVWTPEKWQLYRDKISGAKYNKIAGKAGI
ncbi:MAG: division/cell wall cluster transcriptional repressor MraZ [Elusimicrobiota bacterium]